MYYNPYDPWLSKTPDADPLVTVSGMQQLPPWNASGTLRSDGDCAFSGWNAYLVGRAAGKSLQSWLVLLGYYELSESWPQSLLLRISQLPHKYRAWWLELLRNDPVHVLVETVLLSFLLYLVILRKKSDGRAQFRDRLNDEETDELLREWKQRGRAPLATPALASETHSLTVQSVDGPYITLTNAHRTIRALNLATHDFLGLAADADTKGAATQALTHYGCGSCGPRGFYGTIDAHLDLEHDMAQFTGTHDSIM
jgi:hypothetical protein